jgi:predicted Zn-dependent protease
MHIVILLLGLWACSAAARAEDITAVLERSQRLRLESRVPAPADSARAERIRTSFARIQATAPSPHPVELQVMQGGVQAEAMLGRLLVVGEAVGDLPEGERLMLLAHEYGHLSMDHWHDVLALYRRHVPGEVRPETTDPVARELGRDGHELSLRQEFEADAFGYRLVQRLGVGLTDATSLLMRQPVTGDTATHPATRRRIAQLRALQMRLDAGTEPTDEPPRRAAAAGAPPTTAP